MLKDNFDYVVVDTAPNFDEFVLQAFDETDQLLLVTTLDVPTLKNVKIAVETLDLLNFPKPRRHLVLNRADDKVGLSSKDIEATLGLTVDASVPTSREVQISINQGEPTACVTEIAVSCTFTGLTKDRLMANVNRDQYGKPKVKKKKKAKKAAKAAAPAPAQAEDEPAATTL